MNNNVISAILCILSISLGLPFGFVMIMKAEENYYDDSPWLGFGVLTCLFSLLFIILYFLPPNNVCPTWEEMRPLYIARYRGW